MTIPNVFVSSFFYRQTRDQAVNALVEIYRHVGERVRADLVKKDINASKWVLLVISSIVLITMVSICNSCLCCTIRSYLHHCLWCLLPGLHRSTAEWTKWGTPDRWWSQMVRDNLLFVLSLFISIRMTFLLTGMCIYLCLFNTRPSTSICNVGMRGDDEMDSVQMAAPTKMAPKRSSSSTRPSTVGLKSSKPSSAPGR